MLVKPYNNREALNNALATWKLRFPILRMIRAHFQAARVIIIAAGILHNISIRMGEAEVVDNDEVLNFL